jgi:conflict system STAND superfamily ATPase/TIR domain-containing protein/PDZ domain-containing protein
MSLLFLSHSSVNNAEALAVRDWLVEQGWDDLFLDLDPERGIVAGERWERALHQAANRCDAVLFLISQAWLSSEWCRREFRLAQKLNKQIFGLLIEEIPIDSLPAELTESWQLVDLVGTHDHGVAREVELPAGKRAYITFSESGLTRLKAGLSKAGLDPRFFPWPPVNDPNRPPYRGLLPLESEDAGIFFGREASIIELLAQIRGLREAAPPRFLAILGASGAGKSSFLRAGILPRLNRDDRHFLSLPIIRPEQAVLSGVNGLEQALVAACAVYKMGVTRKQLKDAIGEGAEALVPILSDLSAAAMIPVEIGEGEFGSPTLVMAIDQAEELFLAEGQDESRSFLNLLYTVLQAKTVDLLVLSTIRSDSYENLQLTPELENISQQTFSLPPLPRGAYQQVIEGPAQLLAGTERPLQIEPRLTETLMNDMERGGGKDALPLLAFTLERLYRDYGGDGDLRLDEYQDIGGIEGVIEAAVERALVDARRDPKVPDDEAECLKLLRRGLIPWLAGIDPETQSPRRRVAKLLEVPEEARSLIGHFIDHRLLATDKDECGDITVEPAHETLLRQWDTLQGWLEEDAAALSALETLKSAARDWEANEREEAWLAHSAGRLEDAEAIARRGDFEDFISRDQRAYIDSCREAENQRKNKELEDAKRLAEAQTEVIERTEQIAEAQIQIAKSTKLTAKRTRIGLGIFILLTICTGSLAYWAINTADEVRENNAQLIVNAVEKQMNQKVDVETLAIAKTALESARAHNIDTSELEDLVFKSLTTRVTTWTSPVDGQIFFIKILGQDVLLVTMTDGTVRTIDMRTGDGISNTQSLDSNVISAAVSIDEKQLALGTLDKSIWLIDLELMKAHLLTTISKVPNSISFSIIEHQIVVGTEEGSIIFLDTISGMKIIEEQISDSAIDRVLHAKDASSLAVLSGDGDVYVYRAQVYGDTPISARDSSASPLVGIAYSSIESKSDDAPNDFELLLNQVITNSTAHKAGLQAGDIIRKVNGISVSTLAEANEAFAHPNLESLHEIDIRRGAQYIKMKVPIGWKELKLITKLTDRYHYTNIRYSKSSSALAAWTESQDLGCWNQNDMQEAFTTAPDTNVLNNRASADCGVIIPVTIGYDVKTPPLGQSAKPPRAEPPLTESTFVDGSLEYSYSNNNRLSIEFWPDGDAKHTKISSLRKKFGMSRVQVTGTETSSSIIERSDTPYPLLSEQLDSAITALSAHSDGNKALIGTIIGDIFLWSPDGDLNKLATVDGSIINITSTSDSLPTLVTTSSGDIHILENDKYSKKILNSKNIPTLTRAKGDYLLVVDNESNIQLFSLESGYMYWSKHFPVPESLDWIHSEFGVWIDAHDADNDGVIVSAIGVGGQFVSWNSHGEKIKVIPSRNSRGLLAIEPLKNAGSFVAHSEQGTVQLFLLTPNGQDILEYSDTEATDFDIRARQDLVLVGDGDGDLALYSLKGGERLGRFNVFDNAISKLALSPKGTMAAASNSKGDVSVINLITGNILWSGNFHEVTWLKFDHSGEWIYFSNGLAEIHALPLRNNLNEKVKALSSLISSYGG